MGASNYAICMRCVARAREAEAAQLALLMADYGKIPIAEFDAARAAVKPVREQEFTTFREDYEIYGASDGTVIVDYYGGCGKCGLKLSFRDEHPIEGDEGDATS